MLGKQDLFGNQIENNDWKEEWQDMPEYDHENKWEYQSIIVRFYDEVGVDSFSDLVKQKVYPTTKSIWFPTAVIERCMDKVYTDES